jgi:hypothetical protein
MVVSVWRLLFLFLATSCFLLELTSWCDSLLFCFSNIYVSLVLSFFFCGLLVFFSAGFFLFHWKSLPSGRGRREKFRLFLMIPENFG